MTELCNYALLACILMLQLPLANLGQFSLCGRFGAWFMNPRSIQVDGASGFFNLIPTKSRLPPRKTTVATVALLYTLVGFPFSFARYQNLRTVPRQGQVPNCCSLVAGGVEQPGAPVAFEARREPQGLRGPYGSPSRISGKYFEATKRGFPNTKTDPTEP